MNIRGRQKGQRPIYGSAAEAEAAKKRHAYESYMRMRAKHAMALRRCSVPSDPRRLVHLPMKGLIVWSLLGNVIR